MKTCASCGETTSLGNFTNSRHRKDGKNPYCKKCTRKKSAEYAEKNPDKVKAAGAAWFQANKERRQARAKKWFSENPGKAAEYCARWREKNPGKNNELSRKWYADNREKALASDRQSRQANLEKFLIRERKSYAKRAARRKETSREWRARNKHRVALYAASRRSALAKRTPPWLTDAHFAEMLTFFRQSEALTKETGEPHHVDHIVPLRGKTVSGLNVPWNLQVLPALDNLRKSNSHAA